MLIIIVLINGGDSATNMSLDLKHSNHKKNLKLKIYQFVDALAVGYVS